MKIKPTGELRLQVISPPHWNPNVPVLHGVQGSLSRYYVLQQKWVDEEGSMFFEWRDVEAQP